MKRHCITALNVPRRTERVVRIDGAFDLTAVQRVLATIAADEDLSTVIVDLAHAREIHDNAVALLAAASDASAGRVAARGLREHHRCLLRYLGLERALDGATRSGKVVTMTDQDVSRLRTFVEMHGPEIDPRGAEELEARLAQATVVPMRRVPPDVVTMNSRVVLQDTHGSRYEVAVVYPPVAEPSSGRISVFTHVGAAILGLAAGESIDPGPGAGSVGLHIASIPYQPEAAGDFHL